MERQEEAYTKSQRHLSEDFKLTRKALLVFLEDLYVVVNKAYQAQPQGGNKHRNHIDVVQFGKEQGGDDDGRKNQQAAHGGGAFFLLLPLQAKVAHRLTNRLATNKADEALTKYQHDQQRSDS